MIGKKIQQIRKSKGLSLSECAQRANISKSYLSNIERNVNQNPSIQIIEKIAMVLDVDFHILLETKPVEELMPENEWLDFVEALKESGVDKDQLQEYKTVIEFAKWQNENSGKK
ncbi:helix-turn-helix domain-containing protein [Virgibacillus doumboii]|uniref:helix-turn-helix domain-containing protein n=1 Tax=Virgibacillus doumboii TaxID=2697503 RepID=UPI0013E0178A|nr:helix-turn-helix transcriptional regulator [Virgibacillus doumboii]